jgi:hypothetical protein
MTLRSTEQIFAGLQTNHIPIDEERPVDPTAVRNFPRKRRWRFQATAMHIHPSHRENICLKKKSIAWLAICLRCML